MIPVLFQLGGVQFRVVGISLSETEFEFGADYAAKDVVGAMRPREYMGPADAKITMRGTLFPHKFGGLGDVQGLIAMAALGMPQMVVRGDGMVFGWFVIESVTDTHGFLDIQGLGRFVEYEVSLVSSPMGPSVSGMMSTLTSLFG